MIKYFVLLLVFFISLPLSVHSKASKKSILIFPVLDANVLNAKKGDVDVKTRNRASRRFTKELTKLLQTYFIFSGFRVSSYKTSAKVLDFIQTNKISYKDIPGYFTAFKGLNYIITAKFSTVNNRHSIVVNLIDAKTQELLLKDTQYINATNRALFIRDSLSYVKPSNLLNLVNTLCGRVVGFINKGNVEGQKSTAKNKANRLQIMIIVDGANKMQATLSYLKKNIQSIVSGIHTKDSSLEVEIAFMEQDVILPFTSSIKDVENYINNISLKGLGDSKSFSSTLYKGLIYKGWSIYNSDTKLIFILTNDPFKRKARLSRQNTIAVLPLKYHGAVSNNTDTKELELIKNLFYKDLSSVLDKAPLTAAKDNTVKDLVSRIPSIKDISYYSRYDSIISKLHIQHGINYVVDSLVEKQGDIYNLSVKVKDMALNKTVHSIYSNYNKSLFGIKEDIPSIKHNLIMFFQSLLSKKEKEIISTMKQKSFSRPTYLAVSKSIKIYVMGASVLKEEKDILSRMSRLSGGYYFNLETSYLNNKSTNVSPLSVKVSKGVEYIYNSLDSGRAVKQKHFANFILESDNYYYPFSINNLSEEELLKVKRLIKENKEVVIASPIIPVVPYKVGYQENNKLVEKLIKFTLSPHDITIFIPKENKAISNALENKIEKINQDVYSYNGTGLIKKRKLWFIRGVLKEDKKR